LINNDQEEVVAKIVSKQARSVAQAFKNRNSSTKPTTAAKDHIEWNTKNREALKANNEWLEGRCERGGR
jgi:hypothetical protein